jgi:hypothetical protein
LGGLVFQGSSRDLLTEWSKNNETQGGSQFLYRFSYFVEEDLGKGEAEEDVVLYRKLSHPINTNSSYFLNMVLESVNGIRVKNVRHLTEIIAKDKTPFLKLKFFDIQNPLILKKDEIEKADKEISALYKLPSDKMENGIKK